MTIITRLLFEMISPSWGPTWSALAVGYAVVGLNGRAYLTDAGAEYLAWVGARASSHNEARNTWKQRRL
jgi:hypothetical protein